MAKSSASPLGLGPPPAPDMPSRDASQGGSVLGAPMAAPGAPQSPLQGGGSPANVPPQAQIPAPTHQQTVVALRHFSAIESELTGLLKDPDLGKSDMKSKIIDGTTRLVSNGILTAAQAVTQLGTVPERPYDQKVWLETHFQQTIQAANLVLAHHQAGYLGQTVDTTPPDPDDHQADIAGVVGLYGSGVKK